MFIKRLIAIYLLALLTSCSSTPVPSWQFTEETQPSDEEKLWQHRYDMAVLSETLEYELLIKQSIHPKVVSWRNKLQEIALLPKVKQIHAVNDLVNRHVTYKEDYMHYQKGDVWGFPVQTLEEGGDCEDFVLLKALSLEYLGWNASQLWLIVGHIKGAKDKEWHAILQVEKPNGDKVFLDNMYRSELVQWEEWRFTPVYAMNKQGFYRIDIK